MATKLPPLTDAPKAKNLFEVLRDEPELKAYHAEQNAGRRREKKEKKKKKKKAAPKIDLVKQAEELEIEEHKWIGKLTGSVCVITFVMGVIQLAVGSLLFMSVAAQSHNVLPRGAFWAGAPNVLQSFVGFVLWYDSKLRSLM